MTALETAPYGTISYENMPSPPQHTLTQDEIAWLPSTDLAQLPFHLTPDYDEAFSARLVTCSTGMLTREDFVGSSPLNRWPKGLLGALIARNKEAINLRRPYFYNNRAKNPKAEEAYSQVNYVVDTLARTDMAGKVLFIGEFAHEAASLGVAMNRRCTMTRKMFRHHLGVQPGSTADMYRIVPLANREHYPCLPFSVGEVFHRLANRCDNTSSQAAHNMAPLFSQMVYSARVHTLTRFALMRLLTSDIRTRGIPWRHIMSDK